MEFSANVERLRLIVVNVVVLAALILPILAAASPASPEPAPPLQELAAYVGEWSGHGQVLTMPYSKAAKVGGTTDCRLSPNHGYLVCDQKTQTSMGASNDLSVYTYNERDHAYQFFGLSRSSSRVRTPKLTIEGNRWVCSGGFEVGGKHVTIRTVDVFIGPTTVTYKIEYSADGDHWNLMGSGSSQRLK